MRLRLLACVTIATSAVVACGHVVDGNAVRQPLAGEGNCAKVPAPMSTIYPKHDGEPVMRIPQPPSWQRNTMLDSEVIRYAMDNPTLIANEFAPNALVTLEDITTKGGSPHEIIAKEWDTLTKIGGSDLVTTSDSPVCGLPAQRVTYKLPQMGAIPPHSAAALAVITPGVRKYAVLIGLQTTQPDNPTYAADSQTILDGFEILPEPRGNS
jgi:hypothetical protein